MWRTKPTDRFVLKWIKIHLSAPITTLLARGSWLPPAAITLSSAVLGMGAGVVFALGLGWLAGCIAALAQVLDGVDGQYARLTGRQSPGGAFWDSVLDRYADGGMLIGLVVYLARDPELLPLWLVVLLGSFALVGSNLISYSTARAETLSLGLGPPTLASKGTRMSVMILCAWGTLLWQGFPVLGLIYLTVHPNIEVVRRLAHAARPGPPTGDGDR